MHTVAIVGTGPIGCSAGLALRRRGVTTYLLDDDPEAARAAEALGAGVVPDAGAAPGPAEIALLAVAPGEVARTLAEHQARGTARFYTDVCGVKAPVYRQAEELGCDLTTLVGGHPLVGDGGRAARADLFENRPWALTPGPHTDRAALNSALEVVALCGAVAVLLDPEAHDRAVALVSHAPRLIASLTVGRLLDAEESAVRLADEELRHFTRAACGGAPELWAQALVANAGPVADQLERWAAEALAVAAELRLPTADGRPGLPAPLEQLLRRGAEGRERITGL